MQINFRKTPTNRFERLAKGFGALLFGTDNKLYKVNEDRTVTEIGATSFATAEEVAAGTVADKAVSPATKDGGFTEILLNISQVGTDEPTLVIAKNNRGLTVSAYRDGEPNKFVIDVSGNSLTVGKTFITAHKGRLTNFNVFQIGDAILAVRADDDTLKDNTIHIIVAP